MTEDIGDHYFILYPSQQYCRHQELMVMNATAAEMHVCPIGQFVEIVSQPHCLLLQDSELQQTAVHSRDVVFRSQESSNPVSVTVYFQLHVVYSNAVSFMVCVASQNRNSNTNSISLFNIFV